MIVLVGLTLAALAAVHVAAASVDDYYDIVLANKLVGRLRDPGAFGSLNRRACRVEQNVTEAISVEDVGHPRMWTTSENGRPSIYIGRTFLVQILPLDARGAGTSASALARAWLAGFQQQFPRAEPCTKMGRAGGAAASTGGGRNAPARRAPACVPEADKELVGDVEALLTEARGAPAEGADAKLAELATQIGELVWSKSRNNSEGEFGSAEGAGQAIASALHAVEYVRRISADTFASEKTLVAVTTVKRVRTAVGSTMPEAAPAVTPMPAPAPGG